MNRPIFFAMECVLAAFIAITGAYIAAKGSQKINAKANGDIRTSFAMERSAAAQERIAIALESISYNYSIASISSMYAKGRPR